MRGSLVRGAVFLGLWVILAGFQPADFMAGVVAAGMATSASLHLLPLGLWRFRPFALATFGVRFLRESVAAGIDVAWRALSPRPALRPGFVIYRPRLSQGPTLNAFCTVMCLVPGTLPAGQSEDGGLMIHCLDVDQPIAARAAVEEELVMRALGARPNDD